MAVEISDLHELVEPRKRAVGLFRRHLVDPDRLFGAGQGPPAPPSASPQGLTRHASSPSPAFGQPVDCRKREQCQQEFHAQAADDDRSEGALDVRPDAPSSAAGSIPNPATTMRIRRGRNWARGAVDHRIEERGVRHAPSRVDLRDVEETTHHGDAKSEMKPTTADTLK